MNSPSSIDLLPPALLQPGPLGILLWQWLALPGVLLFMTLGGVALGALTRLVLRRLASSTRSRWDDAIVAQLRGPAAAAWAVTLGYLSLAALGLPAPRARAVSTVLATAALIVFFWTLLRMVVVARDGIAASPWSATRPGLRALLPLAGRVVKALLLATATVTVVAQLGYPVASLVAGLGIGGLALALAAQKTVENLFGTLSIGIDQPFREGDFVKIEDFVATVEELGLRSTRFRTLDRTLVTVPNGRLADMRIETFSARDRMRLSCTVGLVYGTTERQLREVLAGLERVLREQPTHWPDAVVVRLAALGPSALEIEVMAWFRVEDWAAFQLVRQEVLLRFIDVVERSGTSLAFPTQTVHVVRAAPV